MLDRRRLLAGAAGLGLVSSRAVASVKRPALRLAHITDVHLNGERDAPRAVAQMFAHMFADKAAAPELIVNTGDSVMSVDGKVTGAQAAVQVALWREAVKGLAVPLRSCLGNHDIWDGNEPTTAVPAEKQGFRLMTEVLGLPAPYYSFDRGGWHFIAINSQCAWPRFGVLTAEHLAWLKADLKATPRERPVCVLSHLPILSVTSLVYGDDCRKGDDNLVPGIWQHADAWELTELFRRHPNVRLCLSGHMHTQDRCAYRGVWYICGGAASGAWWKGSEYGFAPCYGRVALYADGGFDYDFVDYGWAARAWNGKELPE